MDKYKQILYNYNNVKDTSILYELALERGKNRGWYPLNWVLNDYEKYFYLKQKAKHKKASFFLF